MCVTPLVLPDGTLSACRQCWQCKENRITDWVGRCIAESETSIASTSITLTYGDGDHVRAHVLTYSDVQKWLKLLRRHGFPCRFLVAGEYGSMKGRAHWHAMLFWKERVPEHEEATRFMERHWPHGYSFWEKPTPASIRYICKYIQKQGKQGYLAMSKRPPLGSEYFRHLAAKYVQAGLAPQSPYYWFPEHPETKYYLSGRSLELFLQSYLDQWEVVQGDSPRRVHPPRSELLEEYQDRQAKRIESLQLEPFRPRHAYPWIPAPGGAAIHFSEPHNCHYCVVSGSVLFWSFSDEGERAWHGVIRTETEAERLREVSERRKAPEGYSAAKFRGKPSGTR